MSIFSEDNHLKTMILVWCLGLFGLIWFVIKHHYNSERLRSIRQRRKLTSQGINGPKPSFLHGNALEMERIIKSTTANLLHHESTVTVSHDYCARVFPCMTHWQREYGRVYTYTVNNKVHLFANHPDLAKEIGQYMSTDMGKPLHTSKQLAPLFGNGILRSNGSEWTKQKKIIAPEFYPTRAKTMMGLMKEASELLVRKWEILIEAGNEGIVELNVDQDLKNFSADVIARACFGSSFARGKEIFSKLQTLHKILSEHHILSKATKSRFTKSDNETKAESLEKEVGKLIWETVQERVRESNKNPHQTKDVLQLLLEATNDSNDGGWSSQDSKRFIIDNCKNIYFAGHETTAVSSTWCLMLFSLYPEWQDRVRREVAEHCTNGGVPSFDDLNKMKWLTMFINESLRLYAPGAYISREALTDVRLGNLVVPKGVLIYTLLPLLHRDTENWGPDAHEFKPERFEGGVSNACKFPNAFLPFGAGARTCIGKNFAMIELKLILCILLSNFSFSLSPKYKHKPVLTMILEPAHGVHLMIKKNK